jgi:hypothetical protein
MDGVARTKHEARVLATIQDRRTRGRRTFHRHVGACLSVREAVTPRLGGRPRFRCNGQLWLGGGSLGHHWLAIWPAVAPRLGRGPRPGFGRGSSFGYSRLAVRGRGVLDRKGLVHEGRSVGRFRRCRFAIWPAMSPGISCRFGLDFLWRSSSTASG